MTTKHHDAGEGGTGTSSRSDLYSRITGKIIADLEQGVRPWHRPWNAGNMEGRVMRPLRHNGIPYQGINTIMLWMAAVTNGYGSPHWFTFRQALELGGNVRKGEHGELVVYADRIIRRDTDDRARKPNARSRSSRATPCSTPSSAKTCPRSTASRPRRRCCRSRSASKRPTNSSPRPAPRSATAATAPITPRAPISSRCRHSRRFRDAESYAATLAHECVHWTKHEKRLARDFGRKRFGDEGYAREELVAELGSAFLSADLGITPEVRDDHASYIASWLEGAAERDALHLHRRQPRAARGRLSARLAGRICRYRDRARGGGRLGASATKATPHRVWRVVREALCSRAIALPGIRTGSKEAVRWIRIERRQSRIEAELRRAVGTKDRIRVAHIDIDVRVVQRRGHADAFELPHPDPDFRDAAVIQEHRIAATGHRLIYR